MDYKPLIINITKMDFVTKLAEKYGFNADEANELLKIWDCEHKIALWEAKMGTDEETDAKMREKIEKEKKKLEKLKKEEAKAETKKGKAKAEPKKTKAKAEEKTEAKAEEEKKEKRIKRFSPVMTAQLKKALEENGIDMTDALKKEFQQYIEDLTDDDYRASGLADHMRAFATLKNVKPETVVGDKPVAMAEKAEEIKEEDEKGEAKAETKTETKTEKDEKPKKAPKKAAKKGGDKMVIPEMSSAATIVELSLEELRGIKMTAEINSNPGTYWDFEGRFVKGPESDEDEDVVEVENFNGKKYVVGEKTGRVYEVNTDGDVFAGFAGVGKFKAMEL